MTTQQRAFVNAYLSNGFNATGAAREAGYCDPNADGTKVRNSPAVAAEINTRMAEMTMAADEVLARLTAHARSDMGDLLDDDGMGIDLAKAKEAGKLGLIKSYSYSRKSGVKIDLYDAQSALNTLAKHHKLLTERVEHDFTKLSDEELIARAAGAAGGVGAARADD